MLSIQKIKELLAMGETEGIAKRYAIMNAFDGSLTALGIIIGSFLAHVIFPSTVILAGLGASIAMGVSGGFGAYLTETALKKQELLEKESAMLEEINDTVMDQAAQVSSIFVAVVDGLSPFIASSISFLPFFVILWTGLPIEIAYLTSVFFTAVTLFILGAYLGVISKENKWLYGIRMIIAGVVTGILVMMLEFAVH
ncbi:MAG: VIT1/CCC1 transporter family protein [Candidatus Heimdallarchaeota archaeon]|nr:VIT1/CCC1 transporter family protein [Candidatus Heimdallarchaeota archaeon]